MVLDELAYLTGELQAAASAGAWATAAVTPAASVPVTATASVRRARRDRCGVVIVDLLRGPACGQARLTTWAGARETWSLSRSRTRAASMSSTAITTRAMPAMPSQLRGMAATNEWP